MALDIDVRTTTRLDYSYIESAVVRIGNDTLEVGSHGNYFLNGVFAANRPDGTISGFPISYSCPSDYIHIFEIQLGDGENIVIKVFKDMVGVKLNQIDAGRFHGSVGLLG